MTHSGETVLQLRQARARASSREQPRTPASASAGPQLAEVLAAARALSSQVDVDGVVQTLLRIVLEQAPAGSALLVCLRDNLPRIEARAQRRHDGIAVLSAGDGAVAAADDAPLSLLDTARITRRPVALLIGGQTAARTWPERGLDAGAGHGADHDPHHYSNHDSDHDSDHEHYVDPYFACLPRCAALCLPLLHQDRLVGLLYLERRGAVHPFSGQCVEVLALLAAQAAVSLETARLVGALVAENAGRQRVEDALRASQATLMLGEQINRSGSWTWQTGTATLYCSAQFCRMFGFGLVASAVSFDDFLARVHPDDRERVRLQSLEAVAAGRPIAIDYRTVDDGGGVRFISAVGRPVAAEPAEPADGQGRGASEAIGQRMLDAHYVGTAVDVTARRAAEDSLRQAQAELARVARLTTVGQLSASIAHEVNQPLMSISSNAGACLRWLERAAPPLDEVRAGLEEIAGQSQRAGAIIAGLQALARKRTPSRECIDLHQVVRDILDILRAEMERHGIILELALMAPSGRVLGDAVQLQQVLLNLVTNAIEAMAGVSGHPRVLAICSWSTGSGELALRIDDTGVGVTIDGAAPGAIDAIDAIFDPFYTTKPHGMGMGLAICRTIVSAHHGVVTAAQRQPAGCSLLLRLPELHAGQCGETVAGVTYE